jgi:hypothetical protein
VANAESGPDYSMFKEIIYIYTYIYFNFTYPVRYFRVSPKMSSLSPGVRYPRPVVSKMWDHGRLTIPCVSTACYRDSFTSFYNDLHNRMQQTTVNVIPGTPSPQSSHCTDRATESNYFEI